MPVSQCGCVDGDRYYTLNQVFYPNGKCDKECKCNADGEVTWMRAKGNKLKCAHSVSKMKGPVSNFVVFD